MRSSSAKALLAWILKHGPNEEFLLEREEEGKPVPVLDTKPDLADYLFPAFEGFLRLSAARAMIGTMAGAFPAPLSIADTFSMADEIGWARLEFLGLCQGMDAVYLDSVSKSHANSRPRRNRH